MFGSYPTVTSEFISSLDWQFLKPREPLVSVLLVFFPDVPSVIFKNLPVPPLFPPLSCRRLVIPPDLLLVKLVAQCFFLMLSSFWGLLNFLNLSSFSYSCSMDWMIFCWLFSPWVISLFIWLVTNSAEDWSFSSFIFPNCSRWSKLLLDYLRGIFFYTSFDMLSKSLVEFKLALRFSNLFSIFFRFLFKFMIMTSFYLSCVLSLRTSSVCFFSTTNYPLLSVGD